MTNLQKKELLSIAGGWHLPFGNNNMGCMGSDRNQPVTCYDSKGESSRGWKTKTWDCAKWFCCSGDKGEYFHMVMNNEYYHCKTGNQKTLEAKNPENLKGLI